jgi:hypothetical protein
MNWLRIALLTLAGTWLGLALSGCETESATANNVTITPGGAVLRPGESVALNAAGGFDYKWDLTGSTIYGTLSATRGPTTIYTSIQDPGASTVLQTVQLTSYINGQPTGGTTNGTSSLYQQTAEITITHIGYLLISPASASLSQFGSADFTAQGGRGGYTWSLSKPSLGVLTTTSGSKTTYTATATPGSTAVLQELILRSNADGAEARANITHAAAL